MGSPQSPLTCMVWTEFMQDPSLMYGLFQRGPGDHLIYDPSRVTVLSTELTHNKSKHNRILQVESLVELEEVKQKLKSRPFLLKMYACFSHTEHYVVVKVTTNHRGTYAVLVNPAHSMISTVLDAKFQQAEECIVKGERFCIELDFSPALASFHAEMVDQGSTGVTRVRERSKAEYGRVYITNHTTYQHCFDCNVLWCCLCLPVWCLTAPCYMIYRNRTCKDLKYEFSATPVALRTGLASGQAAEIIRDSRLPDNTVVVQTPMPPVTRGYPAGYGMDPCSPVHLQPPPSYSPPPITQQPSGQPPQPYSNAQVPPQQQQQQQQLQPEQQQPWNQPPPAYAP